MVPLDKLVANESVRELNNFQVTSQLVGTEIGALMGDLV